MADLVLPVKRVYFDQIKAGTKPEEYRRLNEFWARRMLGRTFDRVIITLGYPSKDDHERRLVFPWRGHPLRLITHEFFGDKPVMVFAIQLAEVRP